jgi:chaperonin GroES
MTFEPLGNRIMIALEGGEDMSKGGIYIPEVAKERPQIGKVLAVGPGRSRPDGTIPPRDIKVGDRIVLGKYAGTAITLEGHSFMILDADEVLGVLR